ncbi:VQ motif-containing protein 4, partial [Ancistrocladus abbreviatus]
ILPHHRQKGESNSKNLTSINMLLIESFNGSIYLSLSPMSNWTPNNNIIVDKAAEEKAIVEKGFFLHPSPASTRHDLEPRLLPLFPVTSPRVSGSDS